MTFIITDIIVFILVSWKWLTIAISVTLIVIHWMKVKSNNVKISWKRNISLTGTQKLSFYYTFKKNYSLSAYLDLTRKNPSGKSLVKLKISSHKLRFETGRYDKIPRDERLCSLCNCNKIEDETHFLLDCPSFSSIRDRLFSKIEPKMPFLRLLSHETLLSHLMNCTDYFINIQLISFISSCFEQSWQT